MQIPDTSETLGNPKLAPSYHLGDALSGWEGEDPRLEGCPVVQDNCTEVYLSCPSYIYRAVSEPGDDDSTLTLVSSIQDAKPHGSTGVCVCVLNLFNELGIYSLRGL